MLYYIKRFQSMYLSLRSIDEVIKKYGSWFETIEFAVPKFGDNPNNRIFSEWFSGNCG